MARSASAGCGLGLSTQVVSAIGSCTLLLQMQIFHRKEYYCVATYKEPDSITDSYCHPQELCPLIPENPELGQKQHRECEEAHQGRQGPGPREAAQPLSGYGYGYGYHAGPGREGFPGLREWPRREWNTEGASLNPGPVSKCWKWCASLGQSRLSARRT